MSVQFVKNSFYSAQFSGNGKYSSEKDLRDKIKKNPLALSYNDVDFAQFHKHYKNVHRGGKSFLARKIIAIPVAFSLIVKTVYHLVTALLLTTNQAKERALEQALLGGHTFVEALGWTGVLLSDSWGQYRIEKAQFEKKCIQLSTSSDPQEAPQVNTANPIQPVIHTPPVLPAESKPTSPKPQEKPDPLKPNRQSGGSSSTTNKTPLRKKNKPIRPLREIVAMDPKDLISSIDSQLIEGALTQYPEEISGSWEVVEQLISDNQEIGKIVKHLKETHLAINLSKVVEQFNQVGTLLKIAYAVSKTESYHVSVHVSVADTLGSYQSLIRDSLRGSNKFVNCSLRSLERHSFALLLVEKEQYTEALEVIAEVGEKAKEMAQCSNELFIKADSVYQKSQQALEDADQSNEVVVTSLEKATEILEEIGITLENTRFFWLGIEKYYQQPVDSSIDLSEKEELSKRIKVSGLAFISIGQMLFTAKNMLVDASAHIDQIMTNLPSIKESKRLLETLKVNATGLAN